MHALATDQSEMQGPLLNPFLHTRAHLHTQTCTGGARSVLWALSRDKYAQRMGLAHGECELAAKLHRRASWGWGGTCLEGGESVAYSTVYVAWHVLCWRGT